MDKMAEEIGVADKQRIYAAIIDYAFAAFLSLATIVIISIENPVFNAIVLSIIYLGYFFIFELMMGRTPGKMLYGLTVQKVSGESCGLREVSLRTLTRILETNPLLFGGLPAGLAIIASERRQRLGDMLAQTIVVEKKVVEKKKNP
jgi:uncharacterized RDD family membrane protein YckC